MTTVSLRVLRLVMALPMALLMATLPLHTVTSQGAPSRAPTPATPLDTAVVHAQVRSILVQLFDGMRARDTAAMHALMAPDASLRSVGEREGKPVITSNPIGVWLTSVARAPQGTVLDERLLTQEVRVDGGLASVWAEYELWVGGAFAHCGVDAFLLGQTEQGWRILSIVDTRRRTGCRPH